MEAVKYVGFDDSTGYGVAGRNLVCSLQRAGIKVHWTPVVAGESAYDPYSISQIQDGYGSVIIHTIPEYYPLWVKCERSLGAKGARVWGYTTWETDRIPRYWADLLNLVDGVFVPCQWNKEVFQKGGVTKRIEVLPHVSQFQGRPPEGTPPAGIQKLMERIGKRFVFYFIGAWSERKAPRLLIEAFLSEFGRDENVALVVKTGKQDLSSYRRKWSRPWRFELGDAATAFAKILKTAANGPEIIHLDEELSDHEMAWLHKIGNCFVSLTRGEGWGMGSYEAAWWGKPIITTGIGGPLDYLPGDLSYHVNHKLIPVRDNAYCGSYTSDQRWAEPDLAQARQLMRQIYEDPSKAAKKGMQLRDYVQLHFHSSRIAERCLDSLARN